MKLLGVVCVCLLLAQAPFLIGGEVDNQRERYHQDWLDPASYIKLGVESVSDYYYKAKTYSAQGGLITNLGMFVAGYGRENGNLRQYAFPYILPDTAAFDKYDAKKIGVHNISFGWGIDTDVATDAPLIRSFSDEYQIKMSIGWGRREGESDDYGQRGSGKFDMRQMPVELFIRKKEGALEGARLGFNYNPYRYHLTSYSEDNGLWQYKKDSWMRGDNLGFNFELPVRLSWDVLFKYNQDTIREYSHNFSNSDAPNAVYDLLFYYPNFAQDSKLKRYDIGLRHFFSAWALSGGITLHDGSTWASVDAVDITASDSLGLYVESRIFGDTLQGDRIMGLSYYQISGENGGRTLPYGTATFPELGTSSDALRRRNAKVYYKTFMWDITLSYTQRYDKSVVTYDPRNLFPETTNTWKKTDYAAEYVYRYNKEWVFSTKGSLGRAESRQHYYSTYPAVAVNNRRFSTSSLGCTVTRRF